MKGVKKKVLIIFYRLMGFLIYLWECINNYDNDMICIFFILEGIGCKIVEIC